MSRVPTASPEAIEGALGVPPGRGPERLGVVVTSIPDGGNRGLVRQWLIAKGVPSAVVRTLSLWQLQQAYNRPDQLARLGVVAVQTFEERKMSDGISGELRDIPLTERVGPVAASKPIGPAVEAVGTGNGVATRSQKAEREVAALLKARNPVIWVSTREERRAESHVVRAALSVGYTAVMWDCAQGCSEPGGKPLEFRDASGEPEATAQLDVTLRLIREATGNVNLQGRTLWVLRDLEPWLQGPLGIQARRSLRNLANTLPGIPLGRAQAIVVLSTASEVPSDLQGHVRLLEWPLPDRGEIAAVLDNAVRGLPEAMRESAAPDGQREAAIDAAIGLSAEEAASCYARSLVTCGGKIDSTLVATEKKAVIGREKILQWIDPLPGGRSAVGGLGALWDWLNERADHYTPAARAFGLDAPKGVLLVGIPGTGKSLSAKAVTTAWGIPGVRLDLAGLKSKFVGDSEANLRRVLSTIESIGRCVVWIDEIEKALAGAVQGAADGGVSADALGTILTWMQDRKGESFVVATANDISALPPELLRKGRFDEIWFVDLPKPSERMQILAAALRTHRRSIDALEGVSRVVEATDGWTGSEIAALVPDAMSKAYGEAKGGRDITTEDLLAVGERTVPLARTAAKKIAALREWGAVSARNASRDERAPRAATLAAAVAGDIRQIQL